jgi:hypothetical protein
MGKGEKIISHEVYRMSFFFIFLVLLKVSSISKKLKSSGYQWDPGQF